jgi:uncharacterized membrane protein
MTRRFELRPNQSLSRVEAKCLIGFVGCITLLIGGGFFWLGYTLVLPFSGLEAALVGGALWLCLKRGERREIVEISDDHITISQHDARLRTQRLPRAWARVEILRPPYRWYPSQLRVRSHGQAVELGSFLTEDERLRLAQTLRTALAESG